MTSGVYAIVNILNHRAYIGSSINVPDRQRQHFTALKNNRHHNKPLQRSYNKYGKGVFRFDVLATCEPSERYVKEQFFIDTCLPEFNSSVKVCAIPSRKGCKVPPRTAEHIEKIAAQKRGIPHTATGRANIIAGSWKRGEARLAKPVVNLQNGVFYDCAIDAAESIGMNPYTFRNKLNGSKPNTTKFVYA